VLGDTEEPTLGSHVPTGVGFLFEAGRQGGVEESRETDRGAIESNATAHGDSFQQRL
jgi:hypothetical protein